MPHSTGQRKASQLVASLRQLVANLRQLVANLCQLFSFPDSSLRSPQRPSSALCGFLIRPQKAVHCILCTVYCLPLLPASVGASPPPLPRGSYATDHGVEDPGRSTNTKGTWPHDLAKTVCVCGCVCVLAYEPLGRGGGEAISKTALAPC